MNITTLKVGPIVTNCYILSDETAKVCAVIDPGEQPELIEGEIAKTGCTLAAIYLTHGHFDHCTAVRPLLQNHPDVPVYIHENDVVDGAGSEMKFGRLGEKNQRYYKEGDVLTLGSLTITVWETPGHSSGSVCLLVGNNVFVGDTLFYMCCGRTDFEDGSYESILRSLGRLGKLAGEYFVYPGHDRSTTLSFERECNPFMLQGMRL